MQEEKRSKKSNRCDSFDLFIVFFPEFEILNAGWNILLP